LLHATDSLSALTKAFPLPWSAYVPAEYAGQVVSGALAVTVRSLGKNCPAKAATINPLQVNLLLQLGSH
jgi:hypothetical protein